MGRFERIRAIINRSFRRKPESRAARASRMKAVRILVLQPRNMADHVARKVAELAGTGRVGGMPGHRHAASLLRVHNPPFDAFLPRRRRSSLLCHAQIVLTNETREQVGARFALGFGSIDSAHVEFARKHRQLDRGDHKHWTDRASYHALGHASQKQVLHSGSAVTMRRHHDQVGIQVFSGRGDLASWESGARKSPASNDRGDSVARYAVELKLCFLLPDRVWLQRLRRHLGRVCRHVNDMHETEGSIVLQGNLASYLKGGHGIVIEVDGAQNLAKSVSHKNPSTRCKSGQNLATARFSMNYARARYARSEGDLFVSLRPSTE